MCLTVVTIQFTLGRPYDVFLAKAHSDVHIIKYTRQYTLDAHKLLSDEGMASKLLGFEDTGRWKIVVMQFIREQI